jgi:hypothetical protein
MANPSLFFGHGGSPSDGYHLSLVDPTDLRPFHLTWDGPVVRDNPTGGAVVWLARENGIVLVRCFYTWAAELRNAGRKIDRAFLPFFEGAVRLISPPIDSVW